MFGREGLASLVQGLKDPETGELSSNFKMLTIASAFLVVTIGLIMLQPGLPTDRLAQTEDVTTPANTDLANQPVAATVAPKVVAQAPALEAPSPTAPDASARSVTRLDTNFFTPEVATTAQPAPQAVFTRPAFPAQPRATGQRPLVSQGTPEWFALHKLTASVLTDFGYAPRPGDRLHQLLVQALADNQSDAYVDALLNTAAGRGEFAIPLGLQAVDGRLNTEALLYVVRVRKARN
jgi:hypothetical protein